MLSFSQERKQKQKQKWMPHYVVEKPDILKDVRHDAVKS